MYLARMANECALWNTWRIFMILSSNEKIQAVRGHAEVYQLRALLSKRSFVDMLGDLARQGAQWYHDKRRCLDENSESSPSAFSSPMSSPRTPTTRSVSPTTGTGTTDNAVNLTRRSTRNTGASSPSAGGAAKVIWGNNKAEMLNRHLHRDPSQRVYDPDGPGKEARVMHVPEAWGQHLEDYKLALNYAPDKVLRQKVRCNGREVWHDKDKQNTNPTKLCEVSYSINEISKNHFLFVACRTCTDEHTTIPFPMCLQCYIFYHTHVGNLIGG